MNLKQTLELYAETPQRDDAALVGKPWRVVDKQGWGYGHTLSEHATQEEAEAASMAAPNSKVVRYPQPGTQQKDKDAAFVKSQETNPDLDAEGAAPVSPGSSLFPRDEEVDTQQVRDVIRKRQVKTNPLVD